MVTIPSAIISKPRTFINLELKLNIHFLYCIFPTADINMNVAVTHSHFLSLKYKTAVRK
jgi:hypothetical protein